MFKIKKEWIAVLVILVSSLLFGCDKKIEKSIIVTTPPPDNKYACMSACQAEYQSAFKECEFMIQHESDIAVKDRQMAQCLKNKKFSAGKDTCSARCK